MSPNNLVEISEECLYCRDIGQVRCERFLVVQRALEGGQPTSAPIGTPTFT